jgi:hypothetical protein
MTLAAILFHVSLALSLLQPAAVSPASSPATASNAVPVQDQGNSQQQNSPSTTSPAAPQSAAPQSAPSQSTPSPSSSTPAQKPAGSAKSTVQHSRNKKKVVPSDCDPSSAAGTATSGTAPSSGNSAESGKTSSGAGAGTNQAASKTPAATNCPPTKTIVQEGSTPEPSIQLVGGTDNSSDTAKFLQSTDDNLKKLAGHELNSSQQSMVKQVRQFIDQSKTATAAGDLESARTLAWKAQLLSDELVNPQK